jgi:hypothetical protein
VPTDLLTTALDERGREGTRSPESDGDRLVHDDMTRDAKTHQIAAGVYGRRVGDGDGEA